MYRTSVEHKGGITRAPYHKPETDAILRRNTVTYVCTYILLPIETTKLLLCYQTNRQPRTKRLCLGPLIAAANYYPG